MRFSLLYNLNEIAKKRRIFYVIAIIIIILICSGYSFIIIKQNKASTDRFNQQLNGIARTSTVYLVNSYELYGYPTTIKFSNIVNNFLSENTNIDRFVIFNTEGSVVFDSSGGENTAYGSVEDLSLSYSRSNQITAIKTGNKIITLVSPHFEDWGSHKYSVLFFPSYEQVDKSNWQFSLELGLITVLSILVLIGTALTLTLRERFKLHQEERERLQKIDQQRQEFITLVAHNLRTPVTIIQGYLSLLEEMDISEKQKEMIEPVNETVHNLYLLIEQMLVITELLGQENVSIDKQAIKLKLIISSIVEEHKSKIVQRELVLNQIYSPEDLSVYSNERYLKMILVFLIENAIKFNKPRGKITIRAYEEDNKTVFSIADTGIGIAKDEQKNVFVKFHKVDSHKSVYDYNYGGTGLGLYTAKILVKSLGGEIWFESTEGQGTTFYVSLPASPVS